MEEEKQYPCPYCGSTDIGSKGIRKTTTMGLRRIKHCRDCNRNFTPKNQESASESIQPKNTESLRQAISAMVAPESPSDEHKGLSM